jgi:PAS domain S-box-containing protein
LALDLLSLFGRRRRAGKARSSRSQTRAEAYKRIVDSTGEGVWVVDRDSRTVFANAAMARMLGCGVQEMVGSTALRFMDEPWRTLAADAFRRKRKWAAAKFEFKFKRKDGSDLWTILKATPVFDQRGRYRAALAAAADITELKEKETLLQTVLDASWDGVFMADMSGLFLWVNDAFCRQTGYSRGELLKMGAADLWADGSPGKVLEGIRRVRDLGREVFQPRMRCKGGRVLDIEVCATFIPGGGGRVVVSSRDISERLEAQKRQEVLIENLKARCAEVERFNHLVAHDLQEPLRMVGTHVQIIERRYRGRLDGEADEILGYAVEGSRIMQRMIEGLLVFNRLASEPRRLSEVDMSKVAETAAAGFKAACSECGAIVEKGPLPAISADERQMTHLLCNLISNALKFRGPQPPVVRISAREEGGEFVFSVADNGIGIDPCYAERVFRMFQRLNPRSRFPGEGMGLAFCKKIVESHGGRIWVDSLPGKGATFHFTIPKKGEKT